MSTPNIGKQYPAVYSATMALSGEATKAAHDAGLDPLLIELVKVRVSQLNGCAFCLRMHTRSATQEGETADRLAVLAAWWESQYFSDAECAALEIAERVTVIGKQRTPRTRVDPESVLGEKEIAAITWLAIVMNAWNRVAVASHYPVAP